MEIVDARAVESIAGIDAKTGEVGRIKRDRFDRYRSIQSHRLSRM
jgi:hypothetical protein